MAGRLCSGGHGLTGGWRSSWPHVGRRGQQSSLGRAQRTRAGRCGLLAVPTDGGARGLTRVDAGGEACVLAWACAVELVARESHGPSSSGCVIGRCLILIIE
jgi:hypothetical protein